MSVGLRAQIGVGILLGVVILVLVDGVLPRVGAVVLGSLLIGIGAVLALPRRCKHLDVQAVQDHIGVLTFSVEKECVHCGKRLPR